MKFLLAFLMALLIALQCKLWLGEGGIAEWHQLQQGLSSQRQENDKLASRNARLAAEVDDLRTSTAAIEERARRDLGLVGPQEVFYIVLD